MKTPMTEAGAKERAFARGMPHYEQLRDHDGLKAGDWVLVKPANQRGGKPRAGEVVGFTVVNRKDEEPYVTIKVDFGGYLQERRYDQWKDEDFVGMADPEDVQNANDAHAKENAWMSRNIDTSRQGT